MKKHCVTKRSPGCGSQRLLRCRSHPAGRGPNSSSLFPPLAAVVAVASGLTDGSRAVSTKKEDPLSELPLREGVFFLVSQMTSSISTFTIYSICHSPQKSSAVQKVYKRPLRHLRWHCPGCVLALSVTFGDSSPKGGASGVSVGFHAGQSKHDVSGTVVLRCLGQRQRDKVRLFRSRCPL